MGPGSAEQPIVTARHGLRVTVTTSGRATVEGMSVRRARVLLVRV